MSSPWLGFLLRFFFFLSHYPTSHGTCSFWIYIFCVSIRKWPKRGRWTVWPTHPVTRDRTGSDSMRAAKAKAERAGRSLWRTLATWERTRTLERTTLRSSQINNIMGSSAPSRQKVPFIKRLAWTKLLTHSFCLYVSLNRTHWQSFMLSCTQITPVQLCRHMDMTEKMPFVCKETWLDHHTLSYTILLAPFRLDLCLKGRWGDLVATDCT